MVDINGWISLWIGVMVLIPAARLIQLYVSTKIIDFVLFAGFFITIFFSAVGNFFGLLTDNIIFYQIHHISIYIGFLCLFLHTVRIKWETPPKIIWAIGISWPIIIILFILMWEPMQQPDEAYVVFMDMKRSSSSYFPNGAGLVTSDDTVIYSSGHAGIGLAYFIFVSLVLLYVYITLEPATEFRKIRLVRKLWIIIWFNLLSWSIMIMPWMQFFEYNNGIILIGLLLVAYITFRIPEGVLITQIQILRALNLYNIIEKERTNSSIIELKDYLDRIVNAGIIKT